MKTRKAQTIAIIPARRGSKGVVRKNLRKLGGVELIAHTIKAAIHAKCVDRVFVSTDCSEIASVARHYGAEVPFLRPADLATDSTPMIDVLSDFLRWAKLENVSTVVLLQPTSPLRSAQTIDLCMLKMQEAGAKSAVSVSLAPINPFWLRTQNKNGRLKRVPGFEKDFACRQELPEYYALNGAVYISNPDLILNHNQLLEKNPLGIVIPADEAVDIDTLDDLEHARRVYKRKKT